MATEKQRKKLSAFQRFKDEHDSDHWKGVAEAYQETVDQQARKAATKTQAAPEKKGNLMDTIGKLFFENTAKLANTAAEGARATKELGKAGIARATGNKEAEKAAIKRGLDNKNLKKGEGLFGAGGLDDDFVDMDGGEVAKRIAGGALGVGSEVIPFGRGLQIADKGMSVGKTIARGAGEGVVAGAAGEGGRQLLEDDEDIGKLLLSGGLGGVLGGLGAGVGRAVGRGKAITDESRMLPENATITDESRMIPANVPIRDESRMIPANVPIRDESRLLGPGKTKNETLTERLKEIDARLGEIQANPNTLTSPEKTLADAGDTRIATGAPTRKNGEVDMRTNAAKRQGTLVPDKVAVKNNADEARSLMRERRAVETEINGLDSLPKAEKAAIKVDIKNPKTVKAVESELENIERSVSTNVEQVTGKVNILRDYAGIGMTKTMEKIGLGKTAKKVEVAFEKMRKAQFESEAQVKQWNRATKGDKEARRKIFDYLDGDKNIKLSPSEKKVADEMRAAFSKAADQMGIPKSGRVTNYITRVFDDEFKKMKNNESYDPLLAQITERRAATEVKNPFLKKRTGSTEYKHDAFAAFEAYMRKANRQIHMNKVVKDVAEQSKQKDIDQHTADYLLKSSQVLAGTQRQQAVDKIVDSIVDTTLGTNRGATRALKVSRNMIYRATMGLNVGSAVQNLTQAANTFAEMGTRDTLSGYTKIIRDLGKIMTDPRVRDEYERLGVFSDNVTSEARDYGAVKNAWQKIDKGIWAMFDTAEKINRGAVYNAAKSRAIRQGKSVSDAETAGMKAVSKTQFQFNEIETPPALQGDVAKSLLQFQSFALRQTEFLGKMAKGSLQGNPEELAKSMRWLGANFAIYASIGTLLGMDWKNSIPFLSFRGIKNPTIEAVDAVVDTARGQDEYGNPISEDEEGNKTFNPLDSAKALVNRAAPLVVPGGTQAKKSIQGYDATEQGYSETDSGRVRFPVSQDAETQAQGTIFGQWSLPEAREHFGNERQSLSATQSDTYKEVNEALRPQYYDFYLASQGKNKQRDRARDEIRKLVDEGQPLKAERKVREWNDKVDTFYADFFREYQNPEDDILEAYGKMKIPDTKRTYTKSRTDD